MRGKRRPFSPFLLFSELDQGRCENASTRGRGVGVPQCFNSRATRQVRVEYHESESDVLFLCEECAKALVKDAKRRGYKVYNWKME